MLSLFPLSSQLESELFMANACSCSCDPCTCEKNCMCQGAEAYLGPRWRVMGEHVLSGQLNGVDVAGRIMVQLAVTTTEKSEDWQELLLIDELATQKQVEVLLEAVQLRQKTMQGAAQAPLPVYLAPMHYLMVEQRPMFCACASPDRLHYVRKQQATMQRPLPVWTYNGRVAVPERANVSMSTSNVSRRSER